MTIQNNAPSDAGDSWTELRKQWAKIQSIAATKLVHLSAQGSKNTHLVVFRKDPEVLVGQRFVFDGWTYNITGVQRFDDRQEAVAEVLR